MFVCACVYDMCLCVCVCAYDVCVCARVCGVCGERASERQAGSERAIKREGGSMKEREGESMRTLNALVSGRYSTLHVTQHPAHRRPLEE